MFLRRPIIGEGETPPPGPYAGVGMTFALTILVFVAAGYWLDEKFGTRPWLLICGVFVGATGAFISLVSKMPRSKTWAENKTSTQNEKTQNENQATSKREQPEE